MLHELPFEARRALRRQAIWQALANRATSPSMKTQGFFHPRYSQFFLTRAADRKLRIITRYVSEGPSKLSLANASGWDTACCTSPYNQDSIGKPVACKPSKTLLPLRSAVKTPKPPKPNPCFPLFLHDSKRSGAFLIETATNEIT